MRSKRRLARATLVVPVILSLTNPARALDDPLASTQSAPAPQTYPVLPSKSPSTKPASTYPQGSTPAYRSQGPAALANIPSPQAVGQVASPYRSQGLAAPGTGSPQTATGQATGSTYLGTGGAMNAPSPYESTSAPGTSSPYAATSPTGANAGLGGADSPYIGAAGGGTEANPFPGGGGALSSGLGGFASAPASAFAMIGDASPPFGRVPYPASGPPTPPNPALRSRIAPSVRGFKIAENQSPAPQDRFFFSFNYYNDVNKTLNNYFNAPLKGVEIYRYLFGFEKTYNEGMGSVGILLPIDNVYARPKNPAITGTGGDSTSTGNLTIYLKHIFAINRETGSLATGGVAITPQTGPSNFGGAKFFAPSNTTTIQPFFAYLINRDRFYLQGFSALDVPTDPAQATLFYNDIGIGYYVYRDNESTSLITAVAPTFEVHINSPINHSGAYNYYDNFGTPDIVNLTGGLNTRFYQSSALTLGVVTPVTGPRPFSIEATVLLNVYFGRSRRNPAPPIIGG
jgi:hypothetical protein